MPGMLQVMLIISIVNNSLNITFIVPDCKLSAENIFVCRYHSCFRNLFWISAEKLLQSGMEFMNAVRLVIHKDTLICYVIYVSSLKFLQSIVAFRSLLDPDLFKSSGYCFFYHVASFIFFSHFNKTFSFRRQSFNIREYF